MLILGLTGGIGCGKSSVSKYLARLGATIVDGDQLARQVVQPGEPGLALLVARFGPAVLRADGQLDRAGLGRLVFADAAARADLNALLHPLIREAIAVAVGAARAAGASVCVLDVPLLLEMAPVPACDAIWTVECAPAVQLQRILGRGGLDEAEARARIAAQWPSERRMAAADAVLDNAGTLAQLHAGVDRLWQALPRLP